MPVRKDINFNSGFTGCNDRMAILKNETVPRKLDTFTEINPTDINTDMFVYVDDGESKKIRLGNIINTTASQPDWDETDESSYSYIRNKPDNLVLDRDVTSLFNVGGIRIGDTFEKGTPLHDIIIKLLSFTEKITNIKFGIVDTLNIGQASFIDELKTDVQENKADLLSNGWTHTFTVDNEYYVLAVPAELGIEVKEVLQDGLSLNFIAIKNAIDVTDIVSYETANWDIYLPTKKTYPDEDPEYAKSTGTYTITYKFAEKENN